MLKTLIFITLLALTSLWAGCAKENDSPKTESTESEKPMTERTIVAVLNANTDQLMAIEGVTGVALSKNEDGADCIMILILNDSDEIRKNLPDALEGYPVCVEVSGEFIPMDDADSV